jgi:hypothetical protein
MEEKRTIICFYPSEEICSLYKQAYDRISSKFPNDYMSHAKFTWRPHLMVYLSELPVQNNPKIISVVEKIASQTLSFKVMIHEPYTMSANYIAYGISSPNDELISINKELVKQIAPLRGTVIRQKYLDNWSNYSNEQRRLLKDTGLPYPYESHLSIAKLLPEQNIQALKLISDIPLAGKEFIASEIIIAQDHGVPEEDWPVLAKFQLRKSAA